MKLAFITAGAAGMFCGSCMKDNTLATELIRLNHDAVLIPTYTPITTDEADVSAGPIQFGGINVYLQQKFALFRHTPHWFDKALNFRPLLKLAGRFAVKTQASDLGDLTLSMLEGSAGKQRKELSKFLNYLEHQIKPEVVLLTNVLLSGMVPEIRRRLKVPVWAILQGDDIFLESLPTDYRERCLAQIQKNCASLTGLIATSQYYADFMNEYLKLHASNLKVVYPGLKLTGHGRPREFRQEPPYTIGYFARICPEKGLHILVDAFIELRKTPSAPPSKLKISGWLGGNQKDYFAAQMKKIEAAGLTAEVEYLESPTHRSKLDFMCSIDVLSVPTTYREPKGIYILEALANGVPVVQPEHGSFPELIAATRGGLLVPPNDPAGLAKALHRILSDATLRNQLAESGKKAVFEHFTAEKMARDTLAVLSR
ncbi:glycosyltransferase family 4 protein [Telmatocola sphagniphila]|uniref:Glycosyltransferase family 4 protein n=1 Tax=Telmatocola sphagniphila TaxID=1123043 RepID=A0A8E6B2I3_9BACT|nr:glycosyltransferase family 4 protein [Telmatocola sphagniphila]QVL30915.1 glycosyltransferase family 4 protein [Telmatocola sphagniphila]